MDPKELFGAAAWTTFVDKAASPAFPAHAWIRGDDEFLRRRWEGHCFLTAVSNWEKGIVKRDTLRKWWSRVGRGLRDHPTNWAAYQWEREDPIDEVDAAALRERAGELDF